MQCSGCFPKTHFFAIPVILLCFFVGLYAHGTGDLDLFVFLSGLLALSVFVLVPNFKSGIWCVPKGAVIVSLLAYLAVIWLSVFFSSYPFNSQLFALVFSVLPFVFFVIVLSEDPRGSLQNFGLAIGFGVLVLGVFALLQFFIFEPGTRIHLPMRNPNNLSIIFNMALFPLLGFYAVAKDKRHLVIILGCVFVLVAALLVTQSRAGLLIFAVLFLVFFIFTRRISLFSLVRFLSVLLFVVVFYGVVDLNSQEFLTRGYVDLLNTENGAPAARTISERFAIWSSTWSLIQDHFWTGTGLGTFVYYYPQHRLPQDFTQGFFAHMDPLQFWAEMGIFGALSFYIVAASILCRTVYVGLRADQQNPYLIGMYACFCGLLALFLHTHLSFHLYIPVILFLAGVLLAAWYVCGEALLSEEGKRYELRGSLRNMSVFLYAGVVVIVGVWMGRAALGYTYVERAAEAVQRKDYETARVMLDQTKFYAPKNFSSYYHYEAEYSLNLLRHAKEDRARLYNVALSHIDQAIAYNRGFADLWNLKALIYYEGVKAGEPDGAEKARVLLEETVKANPYLCDARMGLAHLYRLEGQTQKADVLMQELNRLPIAKRRCQKLLEANKRS